MNESELPPFQSASLDKLQAFIEVLLISGLVSGFFAALPFSLEFKPQHSIMKMEARTVVAFLLLESCITFVLLYIVLRTHRETLRDMGWRSIRWRSHVVAGLGLVPILFALNLLISVGFRALLPRYYLDHNPLIEIIQTPQDLALFILSALIAGGIKEELQRAVILIRFREHLGGAPVGLLLWSLAFGAQHYVQGPQGIVAACIYGFLFGAVYLIRGSLIAPIVAHGMYDTVALLAYWFFK